MKAITFHEAAKAVADSNKWPWDYALGYVSGKMDAEDLRKPEHSLKEEDDYAKGYHRGFESGLKSVR